MCKATGEKENYKYLGIVEVDTIKQAEKTQEIKKRNCEKQESLSKPGSSTKTSLINT